MTISAVNNYYPINTAVNQSDFLPEKEIIETPAEVAGSNETENQSSADSPTEEATSAVDSEKGVLRLLQAGHFKGVADIRLRINFNDEIKALEETKAIQLIESSVSELEVSLGSEISGFLLSDELTENEISALSTAGDLLISEIGSIQENISTSSNNTISSLRTAYDNFSSAMIATKEEPIPDIDPEFPTNEAPAGSVITSGDTSTVADQPVIDNPETITPSMFEQFISSLDALFMAALLELETGLVNIAVLPDLSEPRGNGAAYEKFISIYQNMNSQPVEAPVEENLEIMV